MPASEDTFQALEQLPTTGPILAIDWGTKRFGLALSDPQQRLAHPVGVLTRRPKQRFPMKQLRAFLDTHDPVGVLVGLPLTPDGEAGESADAAREVAAVIRQQSGLPVAMHDERFTSARVLASMASESGRHRRTIDDLAATVMLQSFLDARRS